MFSWQLYCNLYVSVIDDDFESTEMQFYDERSTLCTMIILGCQLLLS